MALDNLFSMLGGVGTSAVLLGIVVFAGFPAFSSLVCPRGLYQRLQRGR